MLILENMSRRRFELRTTRLSVEHSNRAELTGQKYVKYFKITPYAGLEPATPRLTAACSTC